MTAFTPPLQLALCLLPVLQNPSPAGADPLAEKILARFAELPADEQERVAEAAYQAALECGHPLAAAALLLEQRARDQALPVLPCDAARHFDARAYAPALGLETTLLAAEEAAWQRTWKHFFPAASAAPACRSWSYDYGRNALAAPAHLRGAAARLRELLAGRWPEPDRLSAAVEAALDHDQGLDPAADYFEHCYRDRDGKVFVGLRLWDVWASGREFEVSDVEALAWLRLVAGESGLQSPIPAAKHREIYNRMGQSFAAWRDYRLLRQALAALHVDPGGTPPDLYSGLTRRLAEAWCLVEHDPGRMVELLRAGGDRKGYFRELEKLEKRRAAEEAYWQLLEQRTVLAAAVRQAVLQCMRNEGLLGLGRR